MCVYVCDVFVGVGNIHVYSWVDALVGETLNDRDRRGQRKTHHTYM